ncbi:hypothetical protein WJ39_17920 [Burkholderia diffusa]|nr:hypothetical protein WJ39_17920 [Burkholderia diffusa]
MLMQQTLTQLKFLKLDGMARAFEEQTALTASTSLSFEERFGMVVERELDWRDTRRLERLEGVDVGADRFRAGRAKPSLA